MFLPRSLGVFFNCLVGLVHSQNFDALSDLLVTQDVSTCEFFYDTNVYGIGANISVTCQRSCTERALADNWQRPGLFGSDVYHPDSNLCLGGIHAGRLHYPVNWPEPTAGVRFAVVHHDRAFETQFRAGVRSFPSQRVPRELGLRPIGSMVSEAAVDITTVHSQFRFKQNEKATKVQCHVGNKEDLSKVAFFQTNGEKIDFEISSYPEGSGGIKQLLWDAFLSNAPRSLVCRQRETLYSDVTSVEFLENPFYEPRALMTVASLGERVTLRGQDTQLTPPYWTVNGQDISYQNTSLVIESAQLKDAGIYRLSKQGSQFGASIMRLNVRGCAAGRFGAQCEQRCPYCLHGGQCHPVTGQCVCPPGFNGTRCQNSCPAGRFGRTCSSSCAEDSENCRGQLLCVADPYGCTCAAGWRGKMCTDACSLGTYGPNCRFACGSCADVGQTCDRFTGSCSSGCAASTVLKPLCLKLGPWFRDPPQLLESGFTSVSVRHRVWDAEYDNGFGTENLRYIIQYRRHGDAQWRRPGAGASVDAGRLADGADVQFTLSDLTIGTSYNLRIVIRDRTTKLLMQDDDKISYINVTTRCDAPGRLTILESLENIDTESVQIHLSLDNAAEACASNGLEFSFQETVSGRRGQYTELSLTDDGSAVVELRALQPFVNYTISALATNSKGSGTRTKLTFRTAEKAPSEPLALSVEAVTASQATIHWRRPAKPNGIIRRYIVTVQHKRYRACSEAGRRDEADVTSHRPSGAATSLHVQLRHAFSVYSVTVAAVTVEPGLSASRPLESAAQVPAAGVASPEAVPDTRSLTLSWHVPDCTAWNDRRENLRVQVLYTADATAGANASSFASWPARLAGLQPYTTYRLQLFLANSVGVNATGAANVTTRTLEAAPSRVTTLSSSQMSPLNFSIQWSAPFKPNGVIRYYVVNIQHTSYKACGRGQRVDIKDRQNHNVTDTKLSVVLRHPFSTYSVSVVAFTVSAGPSEDIPLDTASAVPSRGIAFRRVAAHSASVDVFWAKPACTYWNDAESNMLLFVEQRGLSPWDHGTVTHNRTRARASLAQLTPYSEYTLRMHLGNSAGTSLQVVVYNVSTRPTTPASPSNVTILTVSSTSITLGWEPPRPPLARITGYQLTYSSVDGRQSDQFNSQANQVCAAKSTLGRRCTQVVDGLNENVNYTFQLQSYSYDVGKYSDSETIMGATREGMPGPPESLQADNYTLTTLHISWLEPVERNGRIQQFQLNVTYPAPGQMAAARAPNFFRTHTVPAKDERGVRYGLVQRGLAAGRRYLVTVAARTSAGFGPPVAALLATAVSAPQVAPPPAVDVSRVTDHTVPIQLPRATGEAVTHYYGVVSTDLQFDGSVLTPDHLPNAEEARRQNLNYYVAGVLTKEEVERNSSFVFGNGQYYQGSGRRFYNKPLETGTTYKLGTAVTAGLSEDNQELTYSALPGLVTAQAPTDSAAVAGIVVAVLIATAAVSAAGLLYRKRDQYFGYKAQPDEGETQTNGVLLQQRDRQLSRQRQLQQEEQYVDPADQQLQQERIYANLQELQINYTRVPLCDLTALLRTDAETGQLKSELMKVPSGMSQPCTVGRLSQNKSKNRYANLIAYDASRVILEKLPDDDFSDYINANYIDGYKRANAYIAMQGPKPETVFDFWRMMWQQRSRRIVMLTNLVEGNKRKCDQYWPDETPLRLPGLTVTRQHQQDAADFVIRTLSLTSGDETRTVTHLHYTVWPDHSVPLYPSSLAKFMRVLDSIPDGAAPTVVHCSAGVGRTGTVILIDALYQMGRREDAVDVYSHLVVARQQRANMCANYEQYRLVHQVLVELLVAPDAALPAAQLAERLPQLRAAAAAAPSELQRQLTYLDANPPPVCYSSALADRPDGKNRAPDVLPENRSRVYVHTKGSDSYINAVYVAGYRRPDAFIATEAPLAGRHAIFWKMVSQKLTQSIVVLNNLPAEEVFWPAPGEEAAHDNVHILMKSCSVSAPAPGAIDTFELVIRTQDDNKTVTSRTVQLFVLPLLDDGHRLPTAKELVHLYTCYERSLPSGQTGPAVVVCRDGVTGCGLFLAGCFVLARVAEEQEVDVLLAVATVRKSRPQFVATLREFDLCYEVALAWLEAFDIYANFH